MFKDMSDEKKKRKIITATAVAVIIVLILILLKSCGGNSESTYVYEKDKYSSTGPLSVRDEAEVIDELNRQVKEGMINISMNLCPVFENGMSEGNLFIYNDPVNTHPQIVEIYLKDTGSLVYSSKGIDVGSKIEYAPLDVCLEAGEYKCTAYFSSIDEETGEVLGKAGADILITVLN